jgi:hypothetical protein
MPRSSALQHRIALYGGIVIVNFITFMACVAQFPNEGNDEEQRFHYIDASLAILLFLVIHSALCAYLYKFAHELDYKYCSNGVDVYYLRKGNILWNVRVWGGIKKALKQLPECHTTQ